MPTLAEVASAHSTGKPGWDKHINREGEKPIKKHIRGQRRAKARRELPGLREQHQEAVQDALTAKEEAESAIEWAKEVIDRDGQEAAQEMVERAQRKAQSYEYARRQVAELEEEIQKLESWL